MLNTGHSRERCEILATYLVENESTVRNTAKVFGISKSTVHKDVAQRLKGINVPLYEAAARVMEKNKKERHIRGGIATKNKYRSIRNKKED